MATASVVYDFEQTPVANAMAVSSVSAGAPFTAASLTRSGSPASWSQYDTYWSGYGGRWLNVTHSNGNANTRMLGSWVQMVVTPATGKTYTPTEVSFDASAINNGQVRWRVDVNGALLESGETTTARAPGRQRVTVSLAHLGALTTPTTVRVYWTNDFDAYYAASINDLTFTATYPDPATNVTAAGIPSAEAFGSPQLVAIAPDSNVLPDGIASAEAFGGLQLLADSGVLVVGIASAEAFGLPMVGVTTPELVVPYPTGAEVAQFAGVPSAVSEADETVAIIAGLARGYTRGNGFFADGVKPDLRDVIIVASTRLLANPEQTSITVGSVTRASFFKGWTLAEQRILNHYRKVAF